MTNTGEYNTEFHADYKSGLEEGLRCPIDDGGNRSDRDRPFALGSHDPVWSKGSANRAVKHIADHYGFPIQAGDLDNYNDGKMTIDQLRKYLKKSMLYGYNGNSRNVTPKDLMAFRGYPTYEIVAIEYLHIEMNQSTSLTNTHGGLITATSSDFEGQQVVSSLPIQAGNDYIIWEGKVTLKEDYPMDKVYIKLAQESEMELWGSPDFAPMFTGSYFDRDFGAKTECINSGDNRTFYFRMGAELSNSQLGDDNVWIKFDNNRLEPYGDDAWYGHPALGISLYTDIPVTWDGTKWVGDADFVYDYNPPSTPTLSGVQEVSEVVLTSSEATDDVGVRGYNFYYREIGHRAYTKEESFSRIHRVSVTGDSKYYFYCTAFDAAGNESEPSNEIEIDTTVTNLQIAYVDCADDDQTVACGCGTLTTAVYSENPQGVMDGTHQGKLYQDIQGTIPFVGLYKWWKFSKYASGWPGCSVFVRDTGDIVGYFSCPPPY